MKNIALYLSCAFLVSFLILPGRVFSVPGDANNDGIFDEQDWFDVTNLLLQKKNVEGDPNANEDKKTDVADIIAIIRKYAGDSRPQMAPAP